jgi:UDP-glucuronate decarboxylase
VETDVLPARKAAETSVIDSSPTQQDILIEFQKAFPPKSRVNVQWDEPITIYGEGTQTRSFCYVDDLLNGFLALMDAPDDLPGPVNIGNPTEFTIRELAEMTVELSGSKSQIIKARPLPADDPLQRKPDITLARARLGWEPKVPLREGLARTIAYFKSIDMDQFRAPTPNY